MNTLKYLYLEWSKVNSMNHARRDHAAFTLKNGKVLVCGGFDNGATSTAELYDPSTKNWTIIDSMNHARGEHTVSLLNNGKFLITGGLSNGNFLTSTELYEP
ncbi:unnamed protein product, partial [Rotaria sp. Silwood2]